MLNKFLKVAALSAVLFASSARAEEKLAGFNITVSGDKAFAVRKNDDLFTANNTKLDNGYGFQVAVNNLMDNNFELGVEGGYRIDKQKNKNAFKEGTTTFSEANYENKMFTLLGTGKYYLDLGTNIMPYVGAGIGIARVDVALSVTGTNDLLPPTTRTYKEESIIKKVKLAYSGEAGIAAALSQNAMLGAGVQYFGLANMKKDDYENKDLASGISDDQAIKTGVWSVKGFLKLFV